MSFEQGLWKAFVYELPGVGRDLQQKEWSSGMERRTCEIEEETLAAIEGWVSRMRCVSSGTPVPAPICLVPSL